MPSKYATAANLYWAGPARIVSTALKVGGGGGGGTLLPAGAVGRTDLRPVPILHRAGAGIGARPLAGFAGADRRGRS